MALNAATLAGLIQTKVDAIADSYRNGEKDNNDALEAIAEAIIEHITSDGQVIIASGSSAGTYGIT